MVIRELIRCLTCSTPITLRIGVGHNPYQQHAFLCRNCDEEITVGLEVDVEHLRTTVRLVENCEPADIEGTIVNLEPHFVLAENDMYSDQSFAWMKQARLLLKLNQDWLPSIGGDNDKVMLDVYESLGGIPNLIPMWQTAKKGWSLTTNHRLDLAESVLRKYAPPGFEDKPTIVNVLFDFCGRLLVPQRTKYFQDVVGQLKLATDRFPGECASFRDHYLDQFRNTHMRRYFHTFSEYFSNYTEYDQAILYAKSGVEVPDGSVATSAGFRHTKMFYGNAFENYTANLVILACLNNILEGRAFDQFQTMVLPEYLNTNKANRGRCIEHHPIFSTYLTCLDSTLRNASHHGAMELVDHRRSILYRSGGTGAERRISYSKYLGKCNEIMLATAALLMVELLIAWAG